MNNDRGFMYARDHRAISGMAAAFVADPATFEEVTATHLSERRFNGYAPNVIAPVEIMADALREKLAGMQAQPT